jgi:hypothetical protein
MIPYGGVVADGRSTVSAGTRAARVTGPVVQHQFDQREHHLQYRHFAVQSDGRADPFLSGRPSRMMIFGAVHAPSDEGESTAALPTSRWTEER